jgi:hypothetical protein
MLSVKIISGIPNFVGKVSDSGYYLVKCITKIKLMFPVSHNICIY